MSNDYINGVFSFLALACLVGLFFTAWQSLVVDSVRQRMFEIRDRAFLWAYDHNCLNDEVYKEFRETVNVAIRHYENISLLKLIVLTKMFNLEHRAKAMDFSFLKNEHLKKEFHELARVAGRGLMMRSLILTLLFLCFLPLLLVISILSEKESIRPRQMTRRISRGMEAEILVAASM